MLLTYRTLASINAWLTIINLIAWLETDILFFGVLGALTYITYLGCDRNSHL